MRISRKRKAELHGNQTYNILDQKNTRCTILCREYLRLVTFIFFD